MPKRKIQEMSSDDEFVAMSPQTVEDSDDDIENVESPISSVGDQSHARNTKGASEKISSTSSSDRKLTVTKQDSLVTDSFNKNGRCGRFHVVAKTAPFAVTLTTAAELSETIRVELLYDEDGAPVVPPHNHSNPLQYSVVRSKDRSGALANVRITALSSQYNSALFRLRFVAGDSWACSEPIRVISKRSHARRIIERVTKQSDELFVAGHSSVKPLKVKTEAATPSNVQHQQHQSTVTTTSSSVVASAPLVSAAAKIDVAADSAVSKVLLQMQEEQRRQSALLQQLLTSGAAAVRQPMFTPEGSPEHESNDAALENSFRLFLRAYMTVPADSRPTKMRKLMASVEPLCADQLVRDLSPIAPAVMGSSNECDALNNHHHHDQSNAATHNSNNMHLSSSTASFNGMVNNNVHHHHHHHNTSSTSVLNLFDSLHTNLDDLQ